MVDRFDSRRMSSGHRYSGGQGGQEVSGGGHRYRGTSYGGNPGDRAFFQIKNLSEHFCHNCQFFRPFLSELFQIFLSKLFQIFLSKLFKI